MAQVTSLSEARERLLAQSGGKPPAPTDDQLVEAIENGDGRVAAALYHRLEPIVRRALRRLSGGNAADLDDLVQVAFEKIIVGLKKGRFRKGANLEAWSTVIATRSGMDHLRVVYRRRKIFDFGAQDRDFALPAQGDDIAELHFVRRAMAQLKPAHAEVLFLHDAMGYELKEIAAELDISVSAAQSRLVRTRKELISRLKKQEGRRP